MTPLANFPMKILVTAGNTQTPLDRVRCITNIFSGRTGAQVATRAYERGHAVVLLTSHPETVVASPDRPGRLSPDWRVRTYRTFDDLNSALEEEIGGHSFDVVIHAAAVSDYRAAGIFSLAPGTSFDPTQFIWEVPDNRPPLVDAAAGKVKSSHAELWLRLVPTPKLVDKIRPIWGFTGVLVKFKLEVGLSEVELQEVAERARIHSGADVMVANTLEGMHDWALVGPASLDFQPESSQRVDGQPGAYQKVTRSQLADHLLDAVETVAHSRSTFAKTSPRQGHEGE